MNRSYDMFTEQSPLFKSQYSLTKYRYIVPVPRMEHLANASCPKPEEYGP